MPELPIYLDHHSTTPVDQQVLEAMLPFMTEVWGNPASKDHRFGSEAREALETARRRIGAFLKCRPEEVVFTSGATESNNLALFGVLGDRRLSESHVVVSAVEHSSVLDAAAELERRGARVTRVPVDELGRVQAATVEEALTDQTVLVSVMTANNEVGTVNPISEIGAITRERGILFHTDATQAAGWLSLDVTNLSVDLLSLSGHKVYGPKGVGALYVSRRKPRVRLRPILFGGGHEVGLRSGTVNVPGAVGLAEAVDLAQKTASAERDRLRELTEQMFEGLQSAVGPVRRYGDPTNRLPHNLNISFDGIRAKALVVNLPELAFSTGSACTTQKAEPSHVLLAMGIGEARVREAVRFGLGRSTTAGEVSFAVQRIAEVVNRLKSASAVAV